MSLAPQPFSIQHRPMVTPHASADAPSRRIETVLLATDLTPVSGIATSQAINLAASIGARLLVVNVIDPVERDGTVAPYQHTERLDQQRARRESQLLAIINAARVRGIAAAYLLWTGEAGQGIVSAADAERADLIVVGTRGLDRAGRYLLGSVSDYVVYNASCSVLVAH